MPPTEAQEIFSAHSRSFSLAARLFDHGTRGDIARLYRFCRQVDDLADASQDGEPERLDQIARALSAGEVTTSDPLAHDFLQLRRERQLPLGAALELVEALQQDCGPRALETEGDLIRFAYGVAGTVGLLMRPLLGAMDERAAPFAVDLGIALQLTNIARDVAEDAARDRFYLPAAWADPSTIRKALGAGEKSALVAVDQAVARTLSLAGSYYASARSGHWFIPPRNRRAVYFALCFYEAIGTKLLRRGSGAWTERTRLGTGEKLALGCAALPGYIARVRNEWSRPEPPIHDRRLHLALGPEKS